MLLWKLQQSHLFDAKWYLQHNPDVALAGIPAAQHYLSYGAAEGRLPGPLFDADYYLNQLTTPLTYASPLLHYLAEGQAAGLLPFRVWNNKLWWAQLPALQPLRTDYAALLQRLQQHKTTILVIPVFNAVDALARCLAAVKLHQHGISRVIVVDDASTDSNVALLLQQYQADALFYCVNNDQNLGFSGSVNRGIAIAAELDSSADVVLLNSDTELAAGWLRQLRYAAYSADNVATVTPVSNNAGAFSVAQDGENDVPAIFGLDRFARVCAQGGIQNFPSVPTGHGFCLYVRRAAITAVGYFDAEAFPRGYGEENDFCMRALRAGWQHCIAPRAYVYHQRSASFGCDRAVLLQQGRQIVDQRYPDYAALIQDAFSSSDVVAMRKRAALLAQIPADLVHQVKPRSLFALKASPAEAEKAIQDYIHIAATKFECFVLHDNGHKLALQYYDDGAYTNLLDHQLGLTLQSAGGNNSEYCEVVTAWMLQWAIEQVYVQHSAGNAQTLLQVTKTLGLVQLQPTEFDLEYDQRTAPQQEMPVTDTAHVSTDIELLQSSGLFDPQYYLTQNPDVKDAGVDPALHYLQYGAAEGREPSPLFSGSAYQQLYPDVALSGINPLLHFLRYGQPAGRQLQLSFLGWQASASGPVVLLAGHAAGATLFGAERSLLDVLKALNLLGYQVVVTLPEAQNADYVAQLKPWCVAVVVFPYVWWQAERPLQADVVAQFTQLMQRYQVQWVHANTLVHHEVLVAARGLGIKTAVHVRELPALDPDLCQAMAATPEQILAHLQQYADLVIANSAFTASQYPGCRQIAVVPNTLDCGQFALAPLQPATKLRVALISSNSAKKGLTDFVALAKLAEQQQLPIKCLLIGPDNEQTQQLMQQQAQGELPACLELAGYYQHPAQALQQTDIVLNLSHFQESFGRTVAEAMAAGRVVIAYRWGALPELIQHGENGFLVPFADIDGVILLIRQLLEQPQRLLQVANAARRYAEQEFTGQHFSRQLAAAYQLMDL